MYSATNRSCVAVEARCYGAGQSLQRGNLIAGQTLEEQLSYRIDVPRRRGLDGGAPGVGQDDERAAAVYGALVPADQSPSLHPGQVVGQSTLLPLEIPLQLVRPEAALGCLGELDEHL